MSEKVKLIEAIEQFRKKGWMPGFSGSIAVIQNISDDSNKILVTCDKPKKGYIENNDIFTLRNLYGSFDIVNPLNYEEDSLQLSKWISSFIEIFSSQSGARCAAQLCPKWSILASRMAFRAWKLRSESYPNLLRISHWKALQSFGVENELMVPIINFDTHDVMASSLKEKLSLYSQTPAVLIRDYGLLIWGDSLRDLENKVEIFEHLCELTVLDFNLSGK